MVVLRETQDKGLNKVIGLTFTSAVFDCKNRTRVTLAVKSGRIAVTDKWDGLVILQGDSWIYLPEKSIKSVNRIGDPRKPSVKIFTLDGEIFLSG
jgi:hypothetical protein